MDSATPNELHHIAMSHVLAQIRKLCMPRSYSFADGKTRMGAVRPAFFIGDQPGHNKHLAKTTKGCEVCMAPSDKLDSTDKTFPARDSQALLRSMRRLAESCLDDEERVLRRKEKANQGVGKGERDEIFSELCVGNGR